MKATLMCAMSLIVATSIVITAGCTAPTVQDKADYVEAYRELQAR